MSSDRVLDRYLPLALVAMILAGAYLGLVPLVTVAATLLVTLLATRAWSRYSLRGLRYERKTSDERAFPGDELALSLRLANSKLLPLPWVEIDERVPARLDLLTEDGEPVPALDRGRLRLAGSVSWNESVTWRYRLRCERRGIYNLGPAVVTSGDPFGFFPRSARAGGIQRIIVYPRLIPVDEIDLPSGSPLGEVKSHRWLFEEPTRVVGLRDYRPEDPFRKIHWKATARHQTLQVKVHEPTVELSISILLAIDTFPSAVASKPEQVDERFEYAVSLAASLSNLLVERGIPVGLYANWGGTDADGSLRLPPGSSEEQLLQILESLAGISPAPCCPLDRFLSDLAPRLPWGTTPVVIAGEASEALLASLDSLVRTGRRPVMLPIGGTSAPMEAHQASIERPNDGAEVASPGNGRSK